MLDNVLTNLKARWVLKRLGKNPVYSAAINFIRETLSDTSRGLGKHASQKFKEELAERMLREVGEVLASQDPLLANRERLTGYVLQMAKYQVLILPSVEEPEDDVSGLRGRPGITGELKGHLGEIAERDREIKELAWSLGTHTDQDLFDACLFRYWVAWFMTHVFMCTRIALGDNHPSSEKDWFRPFVAAMCAWEEHNYREAIGLPDVLATQDSYGSVAALKYSTFLNIVMSGAKYPNFEWDEHYKRA